MSSTPKPLLVVEGLTKRYGKVTVLDRCNLQVARGEVHALLGANGAGKSTMVRCIAGLLTPSGGSMKVDGAAFSPANKREAEFAGIEIVQQELNLVPTLSIGENLYLSRMPNSFGVIDRRALRQQALVALRRFGLDSLCPDTLVGTLGVGQQQLIEISAALDRQCRVLILDEPTAALSSDESETLFRWLERLKEQGVSIVYISHRLEEVKRLADRISILRDGKLIGTYSERELSTDRMVELMSEETPREKASGEDIGVAEKSERTTCDQENVLLRVDNLSGGMVRDVSFSVLPGERLGIAGLVGSGRTELLRLIFGADRAEGGAIYRQGRPTPLRLRHPHHAVAAGIAMITEDRKQNGLFLSQSVRFNATIAALRTRFSYFGFSRRHSERREALQVCQSMDTRFEDLEQAISTLSGGNQQKVVIAKWLLRGAEVFLFDEPTRGIDVAARHKIHQLIRSLAESGNGMVIVSSDLQELTDNCDRIAVMSNGRLVATFNRGEWSEERITQAAFSGYLQRSETE